MRLDDGQNGGARMHYEADAKVTGALAGVGQRLIGAAARKTTKEFLEALDPEITQPEAAEHVAETEARLGGCLPGLIGIAYGRWTSRR